MQPRQEPNNVDREMEEVDPSDLLHQDDREYTTVHEHNDSPNHFERFDIETNVTPVHKTLGGTPAASATIHEQQHRDGTIVQQSGEGMQPRQEPNNVDIEMEEVDPSDLLHQDDRENTTMHEHCDSPNRLESFDVETNVTPVHKTLGGTPAASATIHEQQHRDGTIVQQSGEGMQPRQEPNNVDIEMEEVDPSDLLHQDDRENTTMHEHYDSPNRLESFDVETNVTPVHKTLGGTPAASATIHEQQHRDGTIVQQSGEGMQPRQEPGRKRKKVVQQSREGMQPRQKPRRKRKKVVQQSGEGMQPRQEFGRKRKKPFIMDWEGTVLTNAMIKSQLKDTSDILRVRRRVGPEPHKLRHLVLTEPRWMPPTDLVNAELLKLRSLPHMQKANNHEQNANNNKQTSLSASATILTSRNYAVFRGANDDEAGPSYSHRDNERDYDMFLGTDDDEDAPSSSHSDYERDHERTETHVDSNPRSEEIVNNSIPFSREEEHRSLASSLAELKSQLDQHFITSNDPLSLLKLVEGKTRRTAMLLFCSTCVLAATGVVEVKQHLDMDIYLNKGSKF